MKFEWLEEYCLGKRGAEKEIKEEWEATLYRIRGKIFVMQGGDKEGKPIITIKCEPSFGRFLRDEYKDIIPGYHMNKEHWNSVYIGGKVPDEVVKQMIDMSYSLIVSSFSQKVQKEINLE